MRRRGACRRGSLGPVPKAVQGILGLGSGLGCVDDEDLRWVRHQLQGFVAELEITYERVMEGLDPGSVVAHIVGCSPLQPWSTHRVALP